MNIKDLFWDKLFVNELAEYCYKRNYVLGFGKPILIEPDKTYSVETYKEIMTDSLYKDLSVLYKQVKNFWFDWYIEEKGNDENLLSNDWVTKELFEKRDLSFEQLQQYLGGNLDIVPLEEMMTTQTYTVLIKEKEVEYLPFDNLMHNNKVACLQKKKGKRIENNLYFINFENAKPEILNMRITVLKYLDLAYQAKGFWNWQYAFMYQGEGHFEYNHLRLMLPVIFPNVALNLSDFGVFHK